MLADQPFLPPISQPVVHVVSSPTHGREAILIDSHGYHYVVTGNTVLSAQRIRKILAGSADPQAAVGSLSASYRKDGYFLVAVKANVQGKHIHIMVVEGRLTQKTIAPGLGWFYSGLGGNDLNESSLIRRNVLADAYSSREGRQIQVSLAPAQNPGGSALNVGTHPIPGYQMIGGNVLFGNYGSRYSSRYLAGGSAYIHPGMGLEINANFTGGLPGLSTDSFGSQYYQGSVGLNSISPWGTYGFTSQWVNYRIGNIAAPINPNGNIVTYALTGSQLLFANAETRVSVNEGLTRVSNKVTVLQGYYTLTKQNYDYYTLGGTYSRSVHPFGMNAVGTFSINYNQGMSGRSGTLVQTAPGSPTPQFRYLNFNFSYNQSLPLGMSAQLTSSGQWSFSTLPQNQQWVLGGFGNLSAYYPGLLVGDSGYAARLAMQSPAYQRFGFGVTGSMFFETAGVTSYYLTPGQAPWQSLSDIGVGLNISTSWGTNLSVLSALPVGSNNVSAATRNGNQVAAYFVLQQNF